MAHVLNLEEQAVIIPIGSVELEGSLVLPSHGRGVVVFAHGSGSSRLSPRNRYVAGELNRAGVGTLLFDLLTDHEESLDAATGQYRFDIAFLAQRVVEATQWLTARDDCRDRRVGYFGASTGAAAALAAAASLQNIAAVVSRGGRPDLADDALLRVNCPTLLIVGGKDRLVNELNGLAQRRMTAAKVCKLEIVPNATHLFEEPGALEQVARLAAEWFTKYL